MTPSHHRGIGRDHIEQRSHANFFLKQPKSNLQSRPAKRRVQEQFCRVITRFAVDVDGACEIGRSRFIEPPRIGEPAACFSQQYQVSGAAMIETELATVTSRQNLIHSFELLKQRRHPVDVVS